MSFTNSPAPVRALAAPDDPTSDDRPRWRDIHIAAGATGVSYAGDYLAATVLALTMQAVGGYAVAALLVAATLPTAVAGPVAGRIADRVDSRLLLTAVGLAQAGCCLALAFVTGTVAVIALVAALACGLALTAPTFAALLPDMAGRAALPRAAAIRQTATSIGALAGPALAGLLVGWSGTRLPLLLDAVSYLAVAAAGLTIRTRRNAPTAGPAAAPRASASASPGTGVGTGRVPGWRMRDDRLLFGTVALLAMMICAVGAIGVAEVFFVRVGLGASATAFGLVGTVWMAGIIGGAWLVARAPGAGDAALAGRLVLAAGALSATVAASGFVPSVWWLAGLWAVGGCCNGVLSAGIGVLLGRRVPERYRGRGAAGFNAVLSAANLVGFLGGGLLIDRLPSGTVMSGCGLVGVVVVAVSGPLILRAGLRPGRP